MLKIRLQRVGRKHEPAFRLVLTDSHNSSKSGRAKETLGSYDPRKTTDLIKADRVKYWMERGAILTGTVHNLLVNHKIIDAKKVNVLPKKTYTPPVVETPAEAPVEASAPAAEEAAVPAADESPASPEEAAQPSTEESTPTE